MSLQTLGHKRILYFYFFFDQNIFIQKHFQENNLFSDVWIVWLILILQKSFRKALSFFGSRRRYIKYFTLLLSYFFVNFGSDFSFDQDLYQTLKICINLKIYTQSKVTFVTHCMGQIHFLKKTNNNNCALFFLTN